jgi:hypothetical protein
MRANIGRNLNSQEYDEFENRVNKIREDHFGNDRFDTTLAQRNVGYYPWRERPTFSKLIS